MVNEMPKHAEGSNILTNLNIMAGLSHKDRIGSPNKNGIFKKNGWRHDEDSIVNQVKNIEDVFRAALAGDFINKKNFEICLLAFNGLNNMLSGYQTNKNKKDQSDALRAVIYNIDRLITDAQKTLSAKPVGGDNLTIAKNAIRYLKSLNIISNNVMFNGHYKNELDSFIGRHLRQEHRHNDPVVVQKFLAHIKNNHPEKACNEDKAKELLMGYDTVRKSILGILRGPGSQAKSRLKSLLDLEKAKGYSDDSWIAYKFLALDGSADEERIRLARKAIKYGRGNCYEKSSIVATHMLEATRGSKTIFWVECIEYNHCFSIIADKNMLTQKDVETTPCSEWAGDAVIADGWTGDYYSANTIEKKAGLLKLHKNTARKGIIKNYQEINGNTQNREDDEILLELMGTGFNYKEKRNAILVTESLTWPPAYDPGFRLAVAKLKNSSYRRQIESISTSTLAHISDRPDILACELITFMEDT